MKVLDLRCALHHEFEGWFASEDDFTAQLGRGLVNCPLCGDAQIQKMLSAPRLNLRAGRDVSAASAQDSAEAGGASGAPVQPAAGSAQQAEWLKAMRQLMARTEDVGEAFADQARAMHHGEIDPRNIRGRTSPEVALELLEEGIELLPLPSLPALKETLQ